MEPVSLVDVNVHLMDRIPIQNSVPSNGKPRVLVDGHVDLCCHDSGAVERLIAALEIALVRLRDLEARKAEHMDAVRAER